MNTDKPIPPTLPETPEPVPSPRKKKLLPNRNRSRIAQLPADIRTYINDALQASTPYAEITAALVVKGFPGITCDCLHNWNRRGLQLWLRERERIDVFRAQADAALAMAREFKGKDAVAFTEFNDFLLASQINDVIKDFDPKALKRLVDEEPGQYFKLASTINAQASERTRREKAELDLKKYKDLIAEQKRKIQEITQTADGLSPEVLARIEEAAGLL